MIRYSSLAVLAGTMKRLVLAAVLAVSLGALVGVSVQSLVASRSTDVAQTVEAVPYPRTTSPLPVPEVVIAQEPWRDPLPFATPARPEPAKGFVVRCTTDEGVSTDPGACRARPSTGAH